MIPAKHSRIVLAERPGVSKPITDKVFRLERDVETPTSIGDDEVLVQVELLSLDPAMRGWLDDVRSYLPPVQIGAIMRAGGIGKVLKTGKAVKGIQVGDTVYSEVGWTEIAVVKGKTCRVIKPPPGAMTSDYLAYLGMPGMTAYFGLFDVGALKDGEKVFVSGAAGAVGSLVCQLAKIRGCKVMASAGSDEKCQWLKEELGVDLALNYKSPDFAKQFRSFGWLDVIFDNVGGDQLDISLSRLNRHARIVICGGIASYNDSSKRPGFQHYLALISQRARMEGCVR